MADGSTAVAVSLMGTLRGTPRGVTGFLWGGGSERSRAVDPRNRTDYQRSSRGSFEVTPVTPIAAIAAARSASSTVQT